MWAILTVSKKGVDKALEVKEMCKDRIEVDIYTLDKYYVDGVKMKSSDIKELVSLVYYRYETLLFIMASGIVIRLIAPLMESKLIDPAVLVMDDKGQNIVSLLSGHIGGANQKAKELSSIIGARPIITTSSDINGKMAVDTFAQGHNLIIDNYISAKDITARIVNEEKICIINEADIDIEEDYLCENVIIDLVENINDYQGVIYISTRDNIKVNVPFVQLIPKVIVLGIGCKKDTKSQDIIEFIEQVTSQAHISVKAIKTITSVDVKRNEKGIIEVCKLLNVRFHVITRAQIAKVEELFTSSDFVKKTIGVGNVCEACGYISSLRGTCILKKRALKGITLSVWKEKNGGMNK